MNIHYPTPEIANRSMLWLLAAVIPEHYRAGVGIRSMRERAEELGGQLSITPASPHATQVSAWLPLVEWK